MIKFKCPHCGKEVSAGDEHAGKKGRCPGCKELFVIPAGSAKAAPSVERRTPPAADDEDDAPPKKKKYEEDDLEVVEEPKSRAGAKSAKHRPDEDDEEAIAEAPRKKRPSRDDEDDEAVADVPRKKRLARDDDDEDDDRPRKKRGRDDEDDEDEDDRPRKKRKKRRGAYADCPSCGCRGDASMVGFTWWGGIIGPRLFSHVRCNRCGTCYNGKTGDYNTTKIAIYVGASSVIGIGLFIFWLILQSQR
jgi:hypothetical protein